MTHDVVCIGDLHLKSGDQRHETRLRSLDQCIAESVRRPRLAAWVILGDIFDGRSSVQDRNDFAARLRVMAAQAPVLVIRGNHDILHDLLIFGQLAALFPVTVVEEAQVVSLVTCTGAPLDVFCLPYPDRGTLVSEGAAPGDVYAEGQRLLEIICADAGQQLAERRAAGHFTLAAGHIAVGGCHVSTGQPSIGRELELTSAAVQALAPAPLVLGHIHLPQTIFGATYAGSVAACSFGEVERKRYLVVTFDGDALDTPTIQSCPLETPPLYYVEGDLTREGFIGSVLTGPGGARVVAPESWVGCEVRVRYRFLASERDVLNPDVVRAGFHDARRLQLDPVAIPDRNLRAPELAAARTLAEKLTVWAQGLGGAVSPGALEALAQLEHDDQAAVLAALEARVAALEGGAR